VENLRELAEKYKPEFRSELDFLVLGSAINPIFVSQLFSYLDWLRIPALIPETKQLVDVIRNFVSTKVIFRPEDLQGITGAEKRESRIKDLSKNAQIFLEHAPSRKSNFRRASHVWQHMIGRKSELGQMLSVIANDQRNQVDSVRNQLTQWDRQDKILEKIKLTEKNMGRAHIRDEIVGSPRQSIILNVRDAIEIAHNWSQEVENNQKFKDKGTDWITEQITNFRNSLNEILPAIMRKLNKLTSDKYRISTLSINLWQSLYHFQRYFEISDISKPPFMPEIEQWKWLSQGTYNLNEALGNRLLWIFDLPLDDQKQPIKNSKLLRTVLAGSTFYINDSDVKLNFWLKKKDFRFQDLFLFSLNIQENFEISQKIEDIKALCKEELRKEISVTTSEIEQGVVDGIIAEERAEYSGNLETVVPDEVDNFPAARKILQNIKFSLDEARKNRLIDLENRWKVIRPKMNASNMTEDKKNMINNFVAERLKAQDTRIVEENLAHLEDFVDGGVEPDEAWFRPEIAVKDYFQEFMDASEELNQWFQNQNDVRKMIPNIEKGNTIAGIDFSQITKIRRHEITDVLKTWGGLKHNKPNIAQIRNKLLKILRYLGFLLNPATERNGANDRSEANWWHGQIEMSAGDLARPFPQFGSQSNGRYDLVCFWGRPDPNIIAAKLTALGLNNQCVIVIFLGVLSDSQRCAIMNMSHNRKLAMAVLDEKLFAFIAKEQETRLSLLLRCSLPFSALNPYTPFKAGDVPPEMFFGRQDMVRKLQEPGESCFVFGGRQLGKSALLRRVEQEFHDPKREQYAKVIDIKLIGDFGTDQLPNIIWEKLRDSFKEFGLLHYRITTVQPQEIIRHTKLIMEEKDERRVLILFDEADNFLEADAKENFQIVDRFRIIMAETSRRLKLVFAGLHNVQRYQGIPNQPLAHFGSPICVGPLEPKAARQLVEEPLSALGFQLDDATSLRILSYTNYHPGLIQLFCQELLRLMQNKRKSGLPPYEIGQEAVESVYRNPDVYNGIKERFDWTLALDSRYQAVAWSLVVEQMDNRDSYAEAFSTAEILILAQNNWTHGFIETDLSSMRGLLDEMCGLGVLVRDRKGRYRLRSPNLVRIMGTQEDVLAQLAELSQKKPIEPPSADINRAPLDNRARRFSPLTHSQEGRLNKQQTGVAVVLASPALGLNSLSDTYKRFVPGLQIGDGIFKNINVNDDNSFKFGNTIKDIWQNNSKMQVIVVNIDLKALSRDKFIKIFEEALKFTESRKARKRWMRLIFTMEPVTAFNWFALPSKKRKMFEERADAVVHPYKLNTKAIRQRLALSRPEKLHTEDVCNQVKTATGGWPFLLDRFFDICHNDTDPRPAANQFSNMLNNEDSEMYSNFKQSLGVPPNTKHWKIINILLELEDKDIRTVPMDYLTEFIEEVSPELTPHIYDSVEYLKRFGMIDVKLDNISIDPFVKRVCKSDVY